MAAKPLPPVEFLRQCLDYDPETGVVLWRTRDSRTLRYGEVSIARWNPAHAGKPAGRKDGNGRVKLTLKTGPMPGSYQMHRLVWKIVNASDPVGDIDHINGVPWDNRICNLRDVIRLENQRNRARGKNNASGVTGVFWKTRKRRWSAQIGLGGKNKSLGYFNTFDAAVSARKAAEKNYAFHPNHDRHQPSA